MLFISIAALCAATTISAEDTVPTVASVLTSINVGCIHSKCMDAIESCEHGSACEKKLQCIQGEPDLADAVGCFKDVKWPQMDNGLIKILDCGQHQQCMPMTDLGLSFLETEMESRNMPSMAQKASLMQIQEAVEAKLHGHMTAAANSMMMMKAHLMYMEAAGKAVKETTSLIQEVASDTTLAPEEKLQALDHLASHLSQIQHDVQSQQAKIASLAELSEADDAPEETTGEDPKTADGSTDSKAEEPKSADSTAEEPKTTEPTAQKDTDTEPKTPEATAEETKGADHKAEVPETAEAESKDGAKTESGEPALPAETGSAADGGNLRHDAKA